MTGWTVAAMVAALVAAPTPQLVDAAASAGGVHLHQHVPNPYVGAVGYRDAEWAARVGATADGSEPGTAARMRAVADEPTAIWLDSIAELADLPRHLDAAVAQQRAARAPVVVTVVLHDIPNRDCWYDQHGELTVAGNGLARYRSEFVDPLVAILRRSRYARLRVATVIEPRALVNQINHSGPRSDSTAACSEAAQAGVYPAAIGYALQRLHELPQVYTYLDAGPVGQVGWPEPLAAMVRLVTDIAAATPAGTAGVDGFATNVADYSPTVEPFLRQSPSTDPWFLWGSSFLEFSRYVDAGTFAAALRQELVAAGFPDRIGVLLDTSRNGWGGADRPTAPVGGPVFDGDAWVDKYRVDRRPTRYYNWCNQIGAGLGARPQAAPEPGVHAYAWLARPGESDGWGTRPAGSSWPPDGPYEPGCDPDNMVPCCRGAAWPSNALRGAPPAREWHPEQLAQLVRNAYPPVVTGP